MEQEWLVEQDLVLIEEVAPGPLFQRVITKQLIQLAYPKIAGGNHKRPTGFTWFKA
jgi:hypothetical protein